jgi:hypothetical protein
MRVTWLIASLLAAGQVRANVKAVFAHFMVSDCLGVFWRAKATSSCD